MIRRTEPVIRTPAPLRPPQASMYGEEGVEARFGANGFFRTLLLGAVSRAERGAGMATERGAEFLQSRVPRGGAGLGYLHTMNEKRPQLRQFFPVSQTSPDDMTLVFGTGSSTPHVDDSLNPFLLQNSSAAGFPQSFAHWRHPSIGTPPISGFSNRCVLS
jgi:hypothetical protein